MIDFHAIPTAVAGHLRTYLTDYHITQNITDGINYRSKPVRLIVTLADINRINDECETGGADTWDVTIIIGILCISHPEVDETIDDVIAGIEYYTNSPGHGFPAYGLNNVEYSKLQTVSKMIDPDVGLTASASIIIRIMEGS